MSKKHFEPLLFIAVSALALAGCGGSNVAEVEPTEKDLSSWALPLDQFRPPNMHLLAYATDLVMKECMEEQGQPYTVVRYDENAPLQETTNAVGRKLFNLEIAQKYGYHNAPQLRFSAEEAQNRYSANDAAWSAATAECEPRVKERGIDWATITDYAGELAANADYLSGDEVEQALARWQECIAPLGIPDAPANPDDMPGPTLGQKFGLDTAADWDAPPAGQEEIELAIEDAKCRESSGITEAMYDKEFAEQEKLVEENSRDLAPLIEKNKKLTETAREIIREYAG